MAGDEIRGILMCAQKNDFVFINYACCKKCLLSANGKLIPLKLESFVFIFAISPSPQIKGSQKNYVPPNTFRYSHFYIPTSKTEYIHICTNVCC